MIVALTALLLSGSEYCFSQNQETGQTMKKTITQEEHIADLQKRIAATAGNFVPLTADEYGLLLSQPMGTVDGFEPLATIAGGIMVGVGTAPNGVQQMVQTLFPKIPNIQEGDVYVIFDFVKDDKGADYLYRREKSFGQGGGTDEIDEDESTRLTLDLRTAGSQSYWLGSRDVRMGVKTGDNTFEYRSFSDMNSGTASGKVVMHLPTNIMDIVLATGDIGVAKPFAGGIITLKTMAKDKIAFHFSGDTKRIFTWFTYDAKGKVLEENVGEMNEGLFQSKVKNARSIKIYQAEMVRNEYPFSFVQKKKAAAAPPLDGIDAARFSAAMFFQTQVQQTKNTSLRYLDKNDPICLAIKGRAVNDLKKSARYVDPESSESERITTQVNAWPEEKKHQMQALGGKSIEDYAAKTSFDAATSMLVLSSFPVIDQKKIAEGWDIRVQHPGGDTYIAELWEDSHVVSPEAKKEIGERERYYKMMALLYTLEKDGTVTFHSPFQPVIDFLKIYTK